ncbi:MAG: metal-dependent hydrolase [Pyrobaculum sp. OCT_11]|jgi:Predicted Zn-dependent hydrolases of the beta-lactamase fold|nr:MAG: metal-dependent hydrolase [Pyrobaculum sp. OCT_11]
MQIRWYGHAAFMAETGGAKLLIDPWISNPLSPAAPQDVINAKPTHILITHDHFDHLGESVDIAKATGAPIVGTFELTLEVAEKGIPEAQTMPMNIGGTIKLGDGVEIYMTPALHTANRGAPSGFVIATPESTVYHAGDTALFRDMELIAELYDIDVALLPIGSVFTMGPREAAIATQFLRPRRVVPIHYNTFPLIKQDPEDFKARVEAVSRSKVYVMKPGDVLKI